MKTTIIAEAGVNHNGKLANALKLVKQASKSGADFVKFQVFLAENLVTKKAQKAKYQKANTKKEETQHEMLKFLELKKNDFKKIISCCKKNKIKFLASAFDIDSIKLLLKFNQKIFKIPSGEITNFPYLKFLGKQKKKIILSTGMSNLKEIKNAINILTKFGTKKNNISILHCNTDYPTKANDVNLRAITLLKEKYKNKIGYSDHTLGYNVSIAAVAYGSEIIEKHFTLNKNQKGPDHIASLNPEEFKKMVIAIRETEKALGKKEKIATSSESKNKNVVRKSIVASKEIKPGEKFNEKNITTKRPANGISPMKWNKIIGKVAKQKYEKDDFIKT